MNATTVNTPAIIAVVKDIFVEVAVFVIISVSTSGLYSFIILLVSFLILMHSP